jgi:hypothetical protein
MSVYTKTVPKMVSAMSVVLGRELWRDKPRVDAFGEL